MNFIQRFFEEWTYRRTMRLLTKKKRLWVAVSPSQKVQLGLCDYNQAMDRAGQQGRISYTDFEHGIIFVNTDLGQTAQDAPGRSGKPL